MLRRLLRGTVKLGLLAAVVGGLVLVGKKLMGGLGPEPGSAEAPKAWPSLIPEPATGSTGTTTGTTAGGTAASGPSDAGATAAAAEGADA